MKRSNLVTKEETLRNNFSEINDFYTLHKRPPIEMANNLYERLLAKRLHAIKNLYKKYELLSELDIYGLLSKRNPKRSFLDEEDVKESEKFSSLASVVRHSTKKKMHPPQTAKRVKCQNFDLYHPLFIEVRIGLAKEYYEEQTIKGVAKDIKAGDYFIANEVINYVAEMTEERSVRGTNLRLKIITEDKLEYDILYQSFARGLYKNVKLSKRIIGIEKPLPTLDDVLVSGYVYILSSLHNHPELQFLQNNIYKIVIATENSERKINEAHKLTSYLEAPVSVVSVIQCFNLEMLQLKRLINTVLKQYEINNIRLRSSKGITYTMKHWYDIPLSTLENIILQIGNGK